MFSGIALALLTVTLLSKLAASTAFTILAIIPAIPPLIFIGMVLVP